MKSHLIKHMKAFNEKSLGGGVLNLSCDIDIFDQLIKYIQSVESYKAKYTDIIK